MVDFSKLLSKPAGQAKKPPVLPPADYPGIVRSFEYGDNNKNKTPYIRFTLGITNWGTSVEDEWTVADENGQVDTVTKADVDLSKRTMRRDFYYTDDALWRLDAFIRSCGVDCSGRPYDEVIPELVGSEVLIEVQQQLNQQTSEPFNQVGKVVGVAG